MKLGSFCMRVSLVGVVIMLFNCFSDGVNRSCLVSGKIVGDGLTATRETNRHLKENGYHSSLNGGGCDGAVSLEDYRPFDPSPSSKAKVRPGPIEHGTPLMPYIPIPKPSPPSHPDHDGEP